MAFLQARSKAYGRALTACVIELHSPQRSQFASGLRLSSQKEAIYRFQAARRYYNEELESSWSVGRVKDIVAVTAMPADANTFRDDQVGHNMRLKAFDRNVSNAMLPLDALDAQAQQHCMRYNGSLPCRKADWRAWAKHGPSPCNRAAPCSCPDRYVHLTSAWGLCNRQLARQIRADQCMSSYLQKLRVLRYKPWVPSERQPQQNQSPVGMLLLSLGMACF